jgi:hypothetical protein
MGVGVSVEEINTMKVMMAELRKDMQYLSHDVKNLTMKLDALPTIKDVEAMQKRLDHVESNMNKAAWAIIGAWISGIGVVVSIFIKSGAH